MGDLTEREGGEQQPEWILADEDRVAAEIAAETGIIEFELYKRLVRLRNMAKLEDASKLIDALPDPLKVIMPERP